LDVRCAPAASCKISSISGLPELRRFGKRDGSQSSSTASFPAQWCIAERTTSLCSNDRAHAFCIRISVALAFCASFAPVQRRATTAPAPTFRSLPHAAPATLRTRHERIRAIHTLSTPKRLLNIASRYAASPEHGAAAAFPTASQRWPKFASPRLVPPSSTPSTTCVSRPTYRFSWRSRAARSELVASYWKWEQHVDIVDAWWPVSCQRYTASTSLPRDIIRSGTTTCLSTVITCLSSLTCGDDRLPALPTAPDTRVPPIV
jgi:hypothetical protein